MAIRPGGHQSQEASWVGPNSAREKARHIGAGSIGPPPKHVQRISGITTVAERCVSGIPWRELTAGTSVRRGSATHRRHGVGAMEECSGGGRPLARLMAWERRLQQGEQVSSLYLVV
eukprot:EG_transcript_21872